MKRSQPRRDWRLAEWKRGPCRVCGEEYGVELAHLSGREFDPPSEDPAYDLVVRPESVVPLCGPVGTTTTCHSLYDAHLLDLSGYITKVEGASVALDLGLYGAYIRVCAISRAERAAA